MNEIWQLLLSLKATGPEAFKTTDPEELGVEIARTEDHFVEKITAAPVTSLRDLADKLESLEHIAANIGSGVDDHVLKLIGAIRSDLDKYARQLNGPLH